MPYSKNPYLPKVRARAVSMVKAGKGVRLTARHFGVNAGTVSRWVKKSGSGSSLQAGSGGLTEIPTLSSRPKNPKKISREIAAKILAWRPELTYGEIIAKLKAQGVKISLSSVKRIMKRGN